MLPDEQKSFEQRWNEAVQKSKEMRASFPVVARHATTEKVIGTLFGVPVVMEERFNTAIEDGDIILLPRNDNA